ncbi:MAG: tetratricopeptide repeat protein [bacterium]
MPKNDKQLKINDLKQQIEIEPENAQLYAKIGELYNDRGDHLEGLSWCKKAVELDQNNYDYLFLCGLCLYVEIEDHKWYYPIEKRMEMLNYLEKSVEIKRVSGVNEYLLAEAYYREGDFQEQSGDKFNWDNAWEYYEKALNIDPYNSEYIEKQLNVLEIFRENMPTEWTNDINKYLTRLIENDPKDHFSYFRRAVNNFNHGALVNNENEANEYFQKALNDVNNAIEIHDSTRYYFKKIDLLDFLGHFEQAIHECNKIIKKYPNDISGFEKRIEIYKKVDNNKALQLANELINQFSENSIVYKFLGQKYNAMKDINKAIDLNPSDDKLYSLKCSLEETRANKIKSINKAIEIYPFDEHYLQKRKKLLDPNPIIYFYDCDGAEEYKKIYNEAMKIDLIDVELDEKQKVLLQIYNTIIKEEPKFYYGYLLRAVFFKEIQLNVRAIRDIETAVRLHPGSEICRLESMCIKPKKEEIQEYFINFEKRHDFMRQGLIINSYVDGKFDLREFLNISDIELFVVLLKIFYNIEDIEPDIILIDDDGWNNNRYENSNTTNIEKKNCILENIIKNYQQQLSRLKDDIESGEKQPDDAILSINEINLNLEKLNSLYQYLANRELQNNNRLLNNQNIKIETAKNEIKEKNEQIEKMIQQFSHTMANTLFPNTIYEVAKKLKSHIDFQKDAKILEDAYQAEVLVKRQGQLLQARNSGNDKNFQMLIRGDRLDINTTSGYSTIEEILEYAVERVIARFLNQNYHKIDRIREKINSFFKTTISNLKNSYEENVFFNSKQTALEWTNTNMMKINYEIDDTWKNIKLQKEGYAEALLQGYFGELLFNSLKYRDQQQKEWVNIEFKTEEIKGEKYLITRWQNPISAGSNESISTHKGLSGIKNDLEILNETVDDERTLQHLETKDRFIVELSFKHDLLLLPPKREINFDNHFKK